MKKNIIDEEKVVAAVTKEILEESEMTKSEINDIVRDLVKNDRQVNKDIEKKVRNLVAKTIDVFFKTLWQRRNFYEDEIKKG